jgi:hypothetical protein
VSDLPPRPNSVKDYASSQEATFRRRMRDHVRKSALTRAEKDILTAFLNHWFVHRHKGAVHPGKAKLAKKAKVSARSVKYTLSLLRTLKVLKAVAYETGNVSGERGRATEYEVDAAKLVSMCELPPEVMRAVRKGANSRNTGGKNAPFKGAKNAPRNKQCNVIPFRVQESD